jgi:predicted DsbA family dithiol-disulfide isomerase
MYPLSRHPFAQMAAQASLAAANQGRFKEMHDLLFDSYRHFATLAATAAQELGVPATEAESPQVQTALFMGLAEQLGLDMDRFEADLHSRATLRRIARDTQEVRSTGNPGTPASYVNGRYVKGAKPYEAFKEIVDQALKEAGSAVAADSIP